MYIKEIKFKNIISNSHEHNLSFLQKINNGEEDRFFKSTIRDKPRSKYKEGYLKKIAIMGKNASYKTSTLEALSLVLDFAFNFKKNVESHQMIDYDFDKAISWWEYEKGISPFEDGITITDVIKEYNKMISQNSNIEEKIDKYVEWFYKEYVFDKSSPITFKIVFLENDKEITINAEILRKNGKIIYYFRKYNKQVSLYYEKICEKKFVSNMTSAEKYLLYGREQTISNNNFLKKSIQYLFLHKFKKDNEKFLEFMKILDPSIASIRGKIIKSEKTESYVVKEIQREYDNITETISINNLSSGTKIFLEYLFFILKSDFIVIDEIEQSLHLLLVELLIDIAMNNNKQLIFSTHNPLVIKKYIRNYELYIYETKSDNSIQIIKGNSIYSRNDDFINQYVNGFVSGISDYYLDFIKMELYDE